MSSEHLEGVTPQNPCAWKISDGRWKLAVVTRQWGAMLAAGMNILDALTVLGDQMEDRRLRLVFLFLAGKVSGGAAPSQVLVCFPNIFSAGYVGLVRAGEASGQLSENLLRLAEMLERESQLVRRVTSALTYPALVLVVTFVLNVVLFTTVLPNFVTIFEEMRIPLPLLTQVLVGATHACQSPGFWLIFLGLANQIHLMYRSQLSSPQGRVRLERLWQSLPWFGPALRYSMLARYCLTLENLLASGMALTAALKLAARASGSEILEQDSSACVTTLQQGTPLSQHYRVRRSLYPELMANLLQVGEETSSVSSVLGHLARWFQEETESRLNVAQAAMEPALMAFVSVMVGLVVVGIFLPLYSYLGQLGA